MNPDPKALKIEELRSGTGLKSDPPTMPVANFAQEAVDLYKYCLSDREALTLAGLDWKYAEELPVRAEALVSLESDWSKEHISTADYRKKLNVVHSLARKMRNEMVHSLHHVLYSVPEEYKKVKLCGKAGTRPELTQSLYNLSVLGRKHKSRLQAIGMDLSILDNARTTSDELAELAAQFNAEKNVTPKREELRNIAFHHLKEAVDEVRRIGRFVFREDKEKLRGYTSEYKLRINQRYRNKNDPNN